MVRTDRTHLGKWIWPLLRIFFPCLVQRAWACLCLLHNFSCRAAWLLLPWAAAAPAPSPSSLPKINRFKQHLFHSFKYIYLQIQKQIRKEKEILIIHLLHSRVAEVVREHGWHPPKSLDSDENFKPEHTLMSQIKICRDLRTFFGDYWA